MRMRGSFKSQIYEDLIFIYTCSYMFSNCVELSSCQVLWLRVALVTIACWVTANEL